MTGIGYNGLRIYSSQAPIQPAPQEYHRHLQVPIDESYASSQQAYLSQMPAPNFTHPKLELRIYPVPFQSCLLTTPRPPGLQSGPRAPPQLHSSSHIPLPATTGAFSVLENRHPQYDIRNTSIMRPRAYLSATVPPLVGTPDPLSLHTLPRLPI